MHADVLRLFVFARHAESAANAAGVLSTSPSQPVAQTARAAQARALGAQLAGPLASRLPASRRFTRWVSWSTGTRGRRPARTTSSR